jgi:hypothetical protein
MCCFMDNRFGGKLRLLGCLFPLGVRSLICYTAEARHRHDQTRPGGSQTQTRAARVAKTRRDQAEATRQQIKQCFVGRTLGFRVLVFSLCWPQQPRQPRATKTRQEQPETTRKQIKQCLVDRTVGLRVLVLSFGWPHQPRQPRSAKTKQRQPEITRRQIKQCLVGRAMELRVLVISLCWP